VGKAVTERCPTALGKTGVKVSAIGLGGFHLGLSHLEEPDAINIFHSAIDRGINFSDNFWDYNQGISEKRVGKALKNGSAIKCL
jgi:aryl-alcohol dehydrogenase-like predicted oxidoreductase